jgi:hypothetical protein
MKRILKGSSIINLGEGVKNFVTIVPRSSNKRRDDGGGKIKCDF